MLSMNGRCSSRPIWDVFFFLVTFVYMQARKQRLERLIYINKIVVVFMEIDPPFALFQSK